MLKNTVFCKLPSLNHRFVGFFQWLSKFSDKTSIFSIDLGNKGQCNVPYPIVITHCFDDCVVLGPTCRPFVNVVDRDSGTLVNPFKVTDRNRWVIGVKKSYFSTIGVQHNG